MVTSDLCRACWFSLTLFLSLSLSLSLSFLFLSFFCFLFVSPFFSLFFFIFCLFSLSLSFFISLVSSFFIYPFLPFFSKIEPTPALVRMDLIVRCSPISTTLGLLCLTTPNQVCIAGASFRVSSITKEYQGVELMQLPYSWFVLFNLILKWLATKSTRRCIIS
jgi:hypothetical protein